MLKSVQAAQLLAAIFFLGLFACHATHVSNAVLI